MENPQRSTLRKCRVRLVNDLAIDDLFDSIETHDIFTPIMLECIKAKESRPEKVRVFLDYLQRRGPDAFDKFLDCLRESGHSPIASYVIQEFQMQTGQGIPKLNIPSGNQSTVTQPVIPPNIFHTQETIATVAGQPGSVPVQEGQSSGEGQGSRSLQVSGDTDMGDDQEMDDDEMDLSGTLPSSIQESGESQSSLASFSSSGEVTSSGTCSTMSSGTSLDAMSSGVQASSEMTETSTPQTPTISLSIGYTGNLDEEYRMTSNPRGLLLIINNEKFIPPLNNRNGTDVDCDKLKTLFMSLGYGVDVRHNLEAMDMLGTLAQLSMHPQLNEVDSLVVAILTHGSEEGLYGVDGYPVSTADIYEPFTAERCAALHHKPKMFIINACRGDSEDSGSLPTGGHQTCSVTYNMKGMCLPPVKKTDCRIPRMKDFLLAFSTIPGYVSWRHQNDGSWFIQELVKVFAEMSGRKDVLAMLVMVNNAVSKNIGEGVQIPNPSVCLTKSWYLNPMNG